MLIQFAIVFFSCISVFLFSTKSWFRYGFVVGLLGQPFWIYASIESGQWGIFVVAIWFTVSHIRGIRNHFHWDWWNK
jgi:hypothetical protein